MSIRGSQCGAGQAGRAEGGGWKPRDEHALKTPEPTHCHGQGFRGCTVHCQVIIPGQTITKCVLMVAVFFFPFSCLNLQWHTLEYGIAPKIKGHRSKHPWSFLFPVQTCFHSSMSPDRLSESSVSWKMGKCFPEVGHLHKVHKCLMAWDKAFSQRQLKAETRFLSAPTCHVNIMLTTEQQEGRWAPTKCSPHQKQAACRALINTHSPHSEGSES